MTDETILLRAREGHEDAFRQIYDNHREPIYRLAYRYTRSQEDAEDMMQETFIKAFKAIKTFKKNDSRDTDPDANLEMGGFSI
jgi:RNA polymerase sigma-70 factor (ECF subfamily)